MTEQSLLLTDLYELSMLEAYAAHGMAETAVFELFVRKLPPRAGLSDGCRSGAGGGIPGYDALHGG